MKKIAVITGTRADYGYLRPVLAAIKAHPELKLLLVVTGMHLSHEFGYTVREIEKDGFGIDDRVDMLPDSDTVEAMAASAGKGITGMVKVWGQLKPDIIFLRGKGSSPWLGLSPGLT